ncbi:MAG: hypothetical protein HKM99_09610 [Flavobacteriaceae bacterium]|nr:hypothetical protein [Flavobacteriaceae bacterium]
MILTLLIALILLLVIAFLITPVHLYINTPENTYQVRQGQWIKLDFKYDEEDIVLLKIRIIGIPIKPIPIVEKIVNSKKKSKKKKENRKRSNRMGLQTMYDMVRSFHINTFYVDLDTGDPVRNAKLYPLFELLNYRYGGFHINFLGRNYLLMDMEARPISFLKVFIKL